MLKKNGKTAHSAADQKPSQEIKPAEVAGAPSAEPVAESSTRSAPSIVDLAKGLDEKKVDMAEAAGLPIRGLLQWAYAVEVQLTEIQKTLPNTVKQKMAEAIQEAQQRQVTQPQGQPGSGAGISMKDILDFAKGGSGGSIDPTIQYLADIGKETIGLGHFVFKEVIKKAIPEAVEGWEKARQAAAAPKP